MGVVTRETNRQRGKRTLGGPLGDRPVRGEEASVAGAEERRGGGIAFTETGTDDGRTPIHVAIDGAYAGVIYIADTIRPGAREALAQSRGLRTGAVHSAAAPHSETVQHAWVQMALSA